MDLVKSYVECHLSRQYAWGWPACNPTTSKLRLKLANHLVPHCMFRKLNPRKCVVDILIIKCLVDISITKWHHISCIYTIFNLSNAHLKEIRFNRIYCTRRSCFAQFLQQAVLSASICINIFKCGCSHMHIYKGHALM